MKRKEGGGRNGILVDKRGAPTFYCFKITPENNNNHRLEFFEGPLDNHAMKTEYHSVKSLVARIKSLDLDIHTSRENESWRAEKHIAHIKSFPPRAIG